jgi:hypothetical protein
MMRWMFGDHPFASFSNSGNQLACSSIFVSLWIAACCDPHQLPVPLPLPLLLRCASWTFLPGFTEVKRCDSGWKCSIFRPVRLINLKPPKWLILLDYCVP